MNIAVAQHPDRYLSEMRSNQHFREIIVQCRDLQIQKRKIAIEFKSRLTTMATVIFSDPHIECIRFWGSVAGPFCALGADQCEGMSLCSRYKLLALFMSLSHYSVTFGKSGIEEQLRY